MKRAAIIRRIRCGLLEAVIGGVTLTNGETRYGVIFHRHTDTPGDLPPCAMFSYTDLLPLAKLARLSHGALEQLFDQESGVEPEPPLEPRVTPDPGP
ncbi:MAG: hypothetical protein ACKVS8_11095 [Phycisphaerales bacterium]